MTALEGRDIVCLGSQSWGSHLCTPQQIMSRLAPSSRVLYVEPLRSPAWKMKRAATQSKQPPGLREVAPNVWVLTLPSAFVPLALYARVPALRWINHRLMSRWVRQAAEGLGFRDAIAWVYQVTHQGAPLLRQAPLTVYDCIDEWAGATTHPLLQRYLADLDRRMCEEADLLFLGSQGLAAPRRALNPRHALVPQGVDLRHFLPPEDPTPPADIAALPGPVLGLVGVLNRERVDVALLCHLADQRPGWSIALVGPVWDGLDVASLQQRPNIHLLGNKPPHELGRYLAAFDVCLLPYLINDFTRNIFPLKLFEYMASGKPFVATPVPACAEFPRLIRTAEGPAGFLAAVDEALATDDAALRDERIATARANDWDRRAADKARFVADHLASRHARPASPAGASARSHVAV